MRLIGVAFRWIFTNTVSARFGALVIGLVLARRMSPSDFGAFGVTIVALLAVQSIVGLGMARALAQWRGKPDEIAPTAMTISLVLGLAVAGGTYLAAPAFAAALGAPTATSVIRLLTVSIVISSVAVVPRGILQRKAPGRRVLVDRIDDWTGVALTIGLAEYRFGLVSVALGRAAGSLVGAVLFIVLAPRSVRIGCNPRVLGPLLKASVPFAFSSAVLMAIANADQVIIGRLRPGPSLGFYVLAFCCASWPITMFSQPVRDMAPAAFVRFRKAPRVTASAFTSLATMLACATLPTCILLAILAEPLIRVLYGPAWTPAARVLPWLAPLVALRMFYELANVYFATLASPRRAVRFQLAWLVATIPVLILGVWKDGIVGLAVLQLEATAIMLVYWYITELRPAAAWPRLRVAWLAVPLSAAAFVALIALGARQVFPEDGWDVTISAIVTLVVTGLLVYRIRPAMAAVRRAADSIAALPLSAATAITTSPGSVFERQPYPGLAGTSRSAARLLQTPPKSDDTNLDGKDLGRKIRVGTRWSMLNTMVVRIGTFMVSVLLARTVFGPRVWGLYAVSQLILAILLSANELGVSAAVIRWEGDVRAIVRTVLTMSVVSSIVIYALLYVAAPDIARVLGSPAATTVVRVICLCVIIDGFAGVPLALLDRNFSQGRRMLVDLANFVVGTGLTLWLAFAGHGALSFAWGSVAGCLAALAVAAVAAPYVVVPGWDSGTVRQLLRFGLPLAGASLLTLGVVNVDSAIVGATLGPVMLGLYQLAFNISSWPVVTISQVVSRISFAGFSRVADNGRVMADAFNRGLALLVALTVPACVLLGTLAEPLIRTIYGSRWTPAAHVLSLLAVLGLMRVAYGLVYTCMAAAGQRHALMWVQALWLGALIPALIVGARVRGITGVGIGHVVVAGVLVGPAFLWSLSRIGIGARSIARACWRPLFGGVVMAATSLLVTHLAGTGPPGLAAAIVAAIAIYGSIVFPMRTLLRNPLQESSAESGEVGLTADVQLRGPRSDKDRASRKAMPEPGSPSPRIPPSAAEPLTVAVLDSANGQLELGDKPAAG